MAYSNDEEHDLDEWSMRVTQALQILDLKIDHAKLLEVAERSSRAATPSAGPISTFAVGYAAGLAAKSGKRSGDGAVQSAADVVLQLCDEGGSGGPAKQGWPDTGQ